MTSSTPGVSPPDATAGPGLRDIHLPPEPSWWPPAPGWWLLLGLVLGLLGVAVWWWRRRRHTVRARQRVLEEVAQLRTRHQRDADGARLASDLHQLLRRVARVHDPLGAQQRGDAWRATLARVPVDAVTLQQLVTLEQAMYRADAPFDAAHALTAVEAWLRLALRPRQWKSTEATRA
jgi:hypothetical protein